MKKQRSFSTISQAIKEQARTGLKGHKETIPINAAYTVFFLHLVLYIIRFLCAIVSVDYSILTPYILYAAFWLFVPPLIFLWGTRYPFYNFRHAKYACLFCVLLSCHLTILSLIYKLLSRVFLPWIMELPTDEVFTKGMVLLLARIATQLPLVPVGVLLAKAVFYPVCNEECLQRIMAYKITHSLPPEKKKSADIAYNMNIVKDIHSGKNITVYAKDRFLHTLIDGTSGTGKTSSTILPAIRDDLNMRCKAEDLQKEQLQALFESGEISYAPPKGTQGFSINDCIPIVPDAGQLDDTEVEQRIFRIQERLEHLRLAYPVCGITVLAPDDSLTDDVCRLCDARDISYNRIDAVRDANGLRKKNTIGLNPFYLPPHMDSEAKNQLIVKKAVIFSDVMQAITDLKGKADSYFTGLNRQMIANLAILVMATVPVLRNRQATPADLQELINNFNLLAEYVDKLQELDQSRKQYTFIVQYIREDLLGKGREKMEDQSRGTRNIINEFLLMPANREIFCSQHSIDFDRALANGEVTVCNYNLASGDTDAVAFGLFFLLSFNNAVLSRPGNENTRIPHFFYVDELPVLIHPSLEKNFSLFRKFRVSMMVAIQTLDQMEKNEITKYLKGVILGCAHIIVFGRSSLSDMEIFSSLAGVRDVKEVQTSTTETALTDDSPHFSYSSREMTTQKNAIEEIGIRMKDFQEVTFFTTRGGRPLPALSGIVDFLKPSDWERKKRLPFSIEPVETELEHEKTSPITVPEDKAAPESSYRFLPGTPLSIFCSSVQTDQTKEAVVKDNPPNAGEDNGLPAGSERIDDILT